MKKLSTLICLALMIGLPGVQTLRSQVISGISITADAVYGHKDGMALTMDVYMPGDPNGAGVVLINSGGFMSPFFSRQYRPFEGTLKNERDNDWELIPESELEPLFTQQVGFEKLLERGYTVFDVRHGSTMK